MSEADCRVYLGKSGSGKTSLAVHQMKGARRAILFDPMKSELLGKGAVIVTEKRHLLDAVRVPGPLRVCWRGIETMGADAFEWGNACAWAGEGFAILWDEIDMMASTGRLPPVAYKIVNGGRHRGLRVFACSRRPFRVPRDLTAAATRICAFKITGPTDVDYLRPFMGAAADRLPTLAPFTALDWTEDAARERKSFFR